MSSRCSLVILLVLSLLPAPARAGISPAEAEKIAKEALYAQYPELNNPRVKMLSNAHSDRLMKLVFSNPFSLNGETFWNINTQYIWYGDPKIQYHYVGGEKGPQEASSPFEGPVDPAIKAEVVKYLSYLSTNGPLDPNLRVAARPVQVYLFTFYTEDNDPGTSVFKVMGVDDGGQTFHPNPFSTLVPKPWSHP